jgi:hypothetical protein
MPLVLEHIVPRASGGRTVRDNLWLACYRCNEFKGARRGGLDPVTGRTASLFDPRQESWDKHFAWTANGLQIVGLTATGRVTVRLLRLNNPHIVRARRRWVQAGWHPPR